MPDSAADARAENAVVPLSANHSNYLLIGWAFGVLGVCYFAVVVGGLTRATGLRFGRNGFGISISLIDLLAGAILSFFALRRILIARRDGAIKGPLSVSERGAIAGFAVGVVAALVGFRSILGLGVTVAVFGWGPLSLVLCAVTAGWVSRLWKEARPPSGRR